MELEIVPVGHVRGGRSRRGDDGWALVEATIQLDHRFGADALDGLTEFSHIEVVFRFHTLDEREVQTGSRHPRSNLSWPSVGIFAQRGSGRPNRLGVSVCELLIVDGTSIGVRGLDAIDGTPVLDIKPVMAEFLPRGEIRQPAWSTELMSGYWHGDRIDDDLA